VLLEDDTDRSGICLSDDEHAGRMGVRTEGGKRPVPQVGGAAERGPAGWCRKRYRPPRRSPLNPRAKAERAPRSRWRWLRDAWRGAVGPAMRGERGTEMSAAQ
jgi:hypothetical protein